MISRLTASAALFAALATVTLSYAVERPVAAKAQTRAGAEAVAVKVPPPGLPVIVLPTVEVVGRRMR